MNQVIIASATRDAAARDEGVNLVTSPLLHCYVGGLISLKFHVIRLFIRLPFTDSFWAERD